MTPEQKLKQLELRVLHTACRLCDKILSKVEEMRKEVALRGEIAAMVQDLKGWLELLQPTEPEQSPQQPTEPGQSPQQALSLSDEQIKPTNEHTSERKKTSWNPNRRLTVREMAEYLEINEWTLYKWARLGLIPCIRQGRGGRSIRFKLSDIEEWESQQTTGKL